MELFIWSWRWEEKKKFFVLASHSSTPVRREVGRQAGYCSLRELFLSIYSIRRSMTKTFMCYDVFRSVLWRFRQVRSDRISSKYTFLSESTNVFVIVHSCIKKRGERLLSSIRSGIRFCPRASTFLSDSILKKRGQTSLISSCSSAAAL